MKQAMSEPRENAQRRRATRMALVLLLVAAAFYIGFIVLTAMQG